jgi:hypothetical protein
MTPLLGLIALSIATQIAKLRNAIMDGELRAAC